MTLARSPGRGLLSWLLLLSSLLWGAVSAEPTFPELTGRVVDQAGLLDATQEQTLVSRLQAEEDKSGNQLVVVTLSDLQGYDIADYGYRLGRHWGIGEKDRNNGALLIVAPNERKVRIEVGYGLEGHLTDALSSHIIQTEILPRFRAGDYPGGIMAGVDAMLAVIDGSYQARPKSPEGDATIPELVFPLLILLMIFIGQFRPRGKRTRNNLPLSLMSGGFFGLMGWIISGLIAVAAIFAIIAFALTYFGGGGTGGSSGRGGYGGYGGSWGGGGGFSGGGFSGGGGSFGGGGSSGGW